jgi:hypothetical protein
MSLKILMAIDLEKIDLNVNLKEYLRDTKIDFINSDSNELQKTNHKISFKFESETLKEFNEPSHVTSYMDSVLIGEIIKKIEGDISSNPNITTIFTDQLILDVKYESTDSCIIGEVYLKYLLM